MALTLSLGLKDTLKNQQGVIESLSGGMLRVFTGDSPGVEYGATGETLVSGTAYYTSAGSAKVFLAMSGTIAETGTAGYFRLSGPSDNPFSNANGTALRLDGTCGIVNGFCDLLFTDLSMTAGYGVSFSGYL